MAAAFFSPSSVRNSSLRLLRSMAPPNCDQLLTERAVMCGCPSALTKNSSCEQAVVAAVDADDFVPFRRTGANDRPHAGIHPGSVAAAAEDADSHG